MSFKKDFNKFLKKRKVNNKHRIKYVRKIARLTDNIGANAGLMNMANSLFQHKAKPLPFIYQLISPAFQGTKFTYPRNLNAIKTKAGNLYGPITSTFDNPVQNQKNDTIKQSVFNGGSS